MRVRLVALHACRVLSPRGHIAAGRIRYYDDINHRQGMCMYVDTHGLPRWWVSTYIHKLGM
jgi:hypothetical protein